MSTTAEREPGREREIDGRAVGNSFAGDVWVTLKRWLRKNLRNPFVVLEALLTPLIFLVLFTEVFGQITGDALRDALGTDVSYVIYLTPAIVILSAMEAAGNSGIGLVDDMESGMLEKVLVSPTHRGAIFLGKALADVLRIVVQTGMILALGYAVLWIDTGGSVGTYVETGLPGLVGIFAIAVVFSLWFAAFSNIAALVTRDHESTVIWANLLQYPMLFLSSAFLPIEVLPEWMQVLATYNPVTYGVDAVRALMLGRDVLTVIDVTAFSGVWNTVVPAVAALGALGLALCGIATVLLYRTSSSRVD
ncbi:ABC transporter permease [Halosolutus gelatinilyticus]|uniref:ABC transporter permease n=1 Tax=Halosolutus gelatinilyticus TaxID=2931975 RepID=UPI001FF3C4ED|nr:ABC transporter permease [Halosolutus gelatinilyticus]